MRLDKTSSMRLKKNMNSCLSLNRESIYCFEYKLYQKHQNLFFIFQHAKYYLSNYHFPIQILSCTYCFTNQTHHLCNISKKTLMSSTFLYRSINIDSIHKELDS